MKGGKSESTLRVGGSNWLTIWQFSFYMKDIPILDGEEWWASQSIDDTDSAIKSLLDLTKSCMELNVNIDDAKLLLAELSLHSAKQNIELETDKWLIFCASLRGSDVAEMANAVEDELNIFVAKHLRSRRK